MANRTFVDEYERFRSRLAQARQVRGITQTELAARLGRPQSYISKIERGERKIDLIELFELCEALELPPLELIAEVYKGWFELRARG